MAREAVLRESLWRRAGAWMERQSEHLNAILIREIRRALNGRVFILAFLVLLFLCVMACFGAISASGDRAGAGWNVFSFLFMALCGISFLSLPLMVANLVYTEIKERTFELLSITTLTAARIVWGELMTAMGLFVLYTSAVAPFMAFSYLLGGVDIRTIGTGIALAFLGSMILSLVAVVTSAQRTGEASVRVVLAILAMIAFGLIVSLANGWNRPLEQMWDEPNIWKILLLGFTAYATLGAMLFTAATGQLTFASANRARPLRLAVAAHLILTGLAAWPLHDEDLNLGLVLYALILLFGIGIVALGEGEDLTRRQLRTGWFGRRLPTLWSLFLPGARRGLAFVFTTGAVAVILYSLVITFSIVTLDEKHYYRTLHAPLIAFSYLVLYLSSSYLLSLLLPLPLRRPLILRAIPVVLFIVTLLFPFILSLTLKLDIEDNPVVAAFHPLVFLVTMIDRYSFFNNAMVTVYGLYLLAGLVGAGMILPILFSMKRAVNDREIGGRG